MIQREKVMEHLLEVSPSFRGRWNDHLHNIWDRESETILYTDLAEFARYLTELVKNNDFSEFINIFDKIEYLIKEGDSFVTEAIVVGLLEDFQNGLLSNKFDLSLMEKYLRAETKKNWFEVIAFWNQEKPHLDNN